jgi:hypothetical protein
MQVVNIEDALHKSPFTPFDIHVDGRTIRVRHSDFMLFNKSKRTAVVVEGERFHIIDVDQISSLSFAGS